MAGLADAFQFKLEELTAGLKSEVNLGHLVFGEDTWVAVGGKRASCDDPITALYRKYGLLSAPPKLKSGIYEPLFLPFDEFREMWSITSNFPRNGHWSSDTTYVSVGPVN
ncbi:hypothetical protein B0H13DRAFT_2326648 [Mycena leptocephala]|nr:hypothetical protein B0H13DRAFT_2326648 [Mycena leptocephala]